MTSMAQSVVSVQSGPWSNPSTWDCSCVPNAGQSVVVAHSVELLSSITLTHPQLQVTAGGELTMSFPESVTLITDLTNNGHILLIGSILITGQFFNNNFTELIGTVVSDGVITNGPGALIQVEGDITNHDQLGGSGFVCVTDSVINTGSISGPIDLCDGSNTAQQPPFIDSNSGTVAPTVTFCDMGPCATGVADHAVDGGLRTLISSDLLTVEGCSPGATLELFDAHGRRVLQLQGLQRTMVQLPLQGLHAGSYVVVVTSREARAAASFVLTR
jgi:hypothetical protein